MLGGGVALIFLSGPGRYEGQSSPLSFYVPRSLYTICAHGALPPLRVSNPGTVEDRQSLRSFRPLPPKIFVLFSDTQCVFPRKLITRDITTKDYKHGCSGSIFPHLLPPPACTVTEP